MVQDEKVIELLQEILYEMRVIKNMRYTINVTPNINTTSEEIMKEICINLMNKEGIYNGKTI